MLDPEALSRSFTPERLAEGERLAARPQAVEWEQRDLSQGAAAAKLHEGRGRPFSVRLKLKDTPQGTQIVSYCTCKTGAQCAHGAAVALLWAREQDATDAAGPGDPPLTPPLDAWLKRLATAAAATKKTSGYVRKYTQEIRYYIDAEDDNESPPRLKLNVTLADVTQDGIFACARPIMGRWEDVFSERHKHMTKDQRQLWLDILTLNQHPDYRHHTLIDMALTGPEGGEALLRLAAAGVLRWGDETGPLLKLAAPRPGRLAWVMLGDVAVPSLQVGTLEAFALTPPIWVNLENQTLGAVHIDGPAAALEELLAAPLTPPALLPSVSRRITALFPDQPDWAPLRDEASAAGEGAPTPQSAPAFTSRLRLETGIQLSGVFAREIVTLRPAFSYSGQSVDAADPKATLEFLDQGRLIRCDRDAAGEAAALKRLEKAAQICGLKKAPPPPPRLRNPDGALDYALADSDDPFALARLSHELAPKLAEAGWPVGGLRYQPEDFISAGDDWDWSGEPVGEDWLELRLGVDVAGKRLDLTRLFVSVLEALQGGAGTLDDVMRDLGDPVYLPMADASKVAVASAAALRPILAAFQQLMALEGEAAPQDGAPRISRRDYAGLALVDGLFAQSGQNWRGAAEARATAQSLCAPLTPAAAPEGFSGALRPYQALGLAWLTRLGALGFGALLADDMGLGKTAQALAHILARRAAAAGKPCLVIAPTSLLPTWKAEARRFAPGLSVYVSHGADRAQTAARMAKTDLVVTSYALAARDAAALAAISWDLLILDEAQAVKNPAAVTYKAIKTFAAAQKIALTGTPIANHLGELWALFELINPGLLGSKADFTRRYRTPIEKRNDAAARAGLARRLKPFLLRRTKEEVAQELPPRTEISVPIALDDAQRALYEAVRVSVAAAVQAEIAERGLERSRIALLDALLKLRQVCCDPRLVKGAGVKAAAKAGSAKLDHLMAMLPDLIEDGRRVLLFSQFTEMLDLIETAVTTANIPFARLDGSTKNRAAPVKRFQDGKVPLFLISLKAGGVGLTLTAADTVILYDPWWSPAAEAQAIDRAHRIGQDKPVFAYRLVCADTIEDKILALQARKQDLAAGVFDPDAEGDLALSAEEVAALLAGA